MAGENPMYERTVLYKEWSGVIGPDSTTDAVVVSRCTRCEALILRTSEAEEAHDAFHERVDRIERRPTGFEKVR